MFQCSAHGPGDALHHRDAGKANETLATRSSEMKSAEFRMS